MMVSATRTGSERKPCPCVPPAGGTTNKTPYQAVRVPVRENRHLLPAGKLLLSCFLAISVRRPSLRGLFSGRHREAIITLTRAKAILWLSRFVSAHCAGTKFCGAVQIFDLANSTYARAAQKHEPKAMCDWLRPTAGSSDQCRKDQSKRRDRKPIFIFFFRRSERERSFCCFPAGNPRRATPVIPRKICLMIFAFPLEKAPGC